MVRPGPWDRLAYKKPDIIGKRQPVSVSGGSRTGHLDPVAGRLTAPAADAVAIFIIKQHKIIYPPGLIFIKFL